VSGDPIGATESAASSPLRQCDFGLLVSISRCRSSFRTGHAVGRLRLCSYRPLSRCSPGGWTAALERLSEAKIDPPQSPFARGRDRHLRDAPKIPTLPGGQPPISTQTESKGWFAIES
jgi:hypothetical protein